MRTRMFSVGFAELVWRKLWRKLKRSPTVQEYAAVLGGVSTRTAWRYMRLFKARHQCPHCSGTGWSQ